MANVKILIPSIFKHHPITSVYIYVFLLNVIFFFKVIRLRRVINDTYRQRLLDYMITIKPVIYSIVISEISRKNNGRLIRRDAG